MVSTEPDISDWNVAFPLDLTVILGYELKAILALILGYK